MIIPTHQILTYAESNQQNLGKNDLVSKFVHLDNSTKGLDVSKFNSEKNDLQIKFPHKIQGELINKLAEKRIQKNTFLDSKKGFDSFKYF